MFLHGRIIGVAKQVIVLHRLKDDLRRAGPGTFVVKSFRNSNLAATGASRPQGNSSQEEKKTRPLSPSMRE
jgi:hypothetical protein